MTDKQPAGLLRRLGAIIYDALLMLAILFVVTIPFVAIQDGKAVEPGDAIYPLYLLAMLGALYVFLLGFWCTKGRTLGMQSWRLRLETPEGERVSVGAASRRFAIAMLSWACFGLGFLWQLVDRDRLTWHDRYSGTRLVYYPKDPA